MKIGFNNDQYVKLQSKRILERISQFDNKLYLEFGGKLFDDYHASRVLPGFDVNAKIKLLRELRRKAEIIIAVSADDIEKGKVRSDVGLTYGDDVLRLMDDLAKQELSVNSVVITKFNSQASAIAYKQQLEARKIKVYLHTLTAGYPTNVDLIVSEEGYGKNPYIETTKPLVVVTAPGPGSGKMATCLCQLYHESKKNIKAGYAKFETFPIWNLDLMHPVNIAYEAATADLGDENCIDNFHLAAHGETTVNYNRDVEVFPIVRAILERILGECPYKSPTDMGVNMAKAGIFDDEIVCNAAKQEIIRRYYDAIEQSAKGLCDQKVITRIEILMSRLNLRKEDRHSVLAALQKANSCLGEHSIAIELSHGDIISGRKTELMEASSSVVLNAIKAMAGLDDSIKLIPPEIILPVIELKKSILKEKDTLLSLNETLLALSVAKADSPDAAKAYEMLPKLRGLQAHSTVILREAEKESFRKLGVQITAEAVFASNVLFYK